MKHHIFEHCGVMLHVDYSNDQHGIAQFHDIRVMDGNYRPCGPDLRPLLHQALLITNAPVTGARLDAHTFLSAIAMELP